MLVVVAACAPVHVGKAAKPAPPQPAPSPVLVPPPATSTKAATLNEIASLLFRGHLSPAPTAEATPNAGTPVDY
jgi:hypothetical protein